MCGILHYVLDDEDPAAVVATFYDAPPSGSYVFIHHLLATEDPAAEVLQEQMRSGLGRAQCRPIGQCPMAIWTSRTMTRTMAIAR
jgi:S-adenosyl methyltransferase